MTALVGCALVASGCILIDGFGDVHPAEGSGDGGGTATGSSSATSAEGPGPSSGDASGQTASSADVGPGGGEPSSSSVGGGGTGGFDPPRGDLRASYAFGRTGDPDCETSVHDVLRISGATVVVGATYGTSQCDVLEGGEMDSALNFDPIGDVSEWLVVLDDSGTPLEFTYLGESFYVGAGGTGLDGYATTPVRLYRLRADRLGISRTRFPDGGAKAELRTHAFDTETFDVTDIGGVSLGNSDGFVFATDMHEEAGVVTVVGAIRASQGAYSLQADGSAGDFGLPALPGKSALRARFNPIQNAVVSLATDPASAIWAEAEVVPGTFRVGEAGPFSANPNADCYFMGAGVNQYVYLTAGTYGECTSVLQPLEAAALPVAFDIQMAKGDDISAIAAHIGTLWAFGVGAADMAPAADEYFSSNEFLSVRRTRAHGDRAVFSGVFTDSVEVTDVAPVDAQEATDGFVLVYDSVEPGHFVQVGFDGDDSASAADIDDEVVVVGGRYQEPNAGFALGSFATASAGYVVVLEDPR